MESPLLSKASRLEGLSQHGNDLLVLPQELTAQLLLLEDVLARGVRAVGHIHMAHVVLAAQAAEHVAEQAPQDISRGVQLAVQAMGVGVEDLLVPGDVAQGGAQVRDDAIQLHQPGLLRAVGVEGREVGHVGAAQLVQVVGEGLPLGRVIEDKEAVGTAVELSQLVSDLVHEVAGTGMAGGAGGIDWGDGKGAPGPVFPVQNQQQGHDS